MAETNETAFLTKDTPVNVTIVGDYDEGDKSGMLNFDGTYKGFQVLGGQTILGFERTVGNGKKATVEMFTVTSDKVLYITPKAAEEEEEVEEEKATKKGKAAAADDEE